MPGESDSISQGDIEELLRKREGAYRRIIIPAALKWVPLKASA